MKKWTRRGFVGSLSGAAAALLSPASAKGSLVSPLESGTGRAPIKITDLRCAVIGRNPTVRIANAETACGELHFRTGAFQPPSWLWRRYLPAR